MSKKGLYKGLEIQRKEFRGVQGPASLIWTQGVNPMLRDTKTVDTIKPFLSPEEGKNALTFELPAADFYAIVKDTVEVYNLLAEILGDQKLLKTKELAALTTDNMKALQAEKDPVARIFLLHAYIRQLIKKLGEGFKARTPAVAEQARPRAITKILLRAHQLVSYTQEKLQQAKEKVAVTSTEARTYLAGIEGETLSRRDALRALQRAAQIFPAITFSSVPGDQRGTKRLTLQKDDLPGAEFQSPAKCAKRQRSRIEEVLPWLNAAF